MYPCLWGTYMNRWTMTSANSIAWDMMKTHDTTHEQWNIDTFSPGPGPYVDLHHHLVTSGYQGELDDGAPGSLRLHPRFLISYASRPLFLLFFQSHVIRNPSPSSPLNFHQRFVAIKVHTIDKIKNYQLIRINKHFQRWEGKKQRRWRR